MRILAQLNFEILYEILIYYNTVITTRDSFNSSPVTKLSYR